MTIHYHATPISPRRELDRLAGRFFCVSFSRPEDCGHVHRIGQGVLLDNGAFSAWTRQAEPDWPAYYAWAERWLDFHTTWAIIPDVIDGDEAANECPARWVRRPVQEVLA